MVKFHILIFVTFILTNILSLIRLQRFYLVGDGLTLVLKCVKLTILQYFSDHLTKTELAGMGIAAAV